MKNTLKLVGITTDSRRASGDINRTGTTFLILAIALIAILGCTKQSRTATQPQTTTEGNTTAVQTEGKTNIDSPANTSSSRFLFEQNFAQNNITGIMGGDFFSAEYETYEYLPNIGFSAGKRTIYNGTILLLDYIIPNSALAVLSKEELRLLRNTIYAKHGMIFQSNDLTKHFQQFVWYNPKSGNVDALLTDVDKTNIENIQLFESAKPNHKVNKNVLVKEYLSMRPAPSDCSDLRINGDGAISKRQFPMNEDNWKGTYRIENGFLVVLVTGQRVSDHYSKLKNWQWPDGVTFSVENYIDITYYDVTYTTPIKMIFPIGDEISLAQEYGDESYGDISYRKIGSEKWF
jgi:hypothetical protein